MIRDDRNGLKAWGIIWIVLALPSAFIPLVTFLEDFQHPSLLARDFHGVISTLLLYMVFSLVQGGLFLVQAPRWQCVNYRRQMAATWGFAARVPLAYPHPLPNVGALLLPFTIKLRPNWPVYLVPLGGFVGLFLLIQTGFNLPGGFILGWITGALLGTTPGVFFSQKIEVTQEGLTVRHSFHDWFETSNMGWRWGKYTIRWNEARLFAIRDGKLGAPATHYELSSPYAVVKWQRIRHPRWWSLHRPAIPFAEYDAQMDALIALISGVTGLPLYDVR